MHYFSLRSLLAFVMISATAFGQIDSVNVYIDQGIALYDNGEYHKAISHYQKALRLDENSSLAHYEIALTYLSTQDYELAEEHSKKSLSYKDNNALAAYICLGNALDLQGKTEEALQAYEEGMEQFDHYLLYYNHAITCLNSGLLDKAYQSAMNAINSNNGHASSHLILSKIMKEKGSRVKAMLAMYFFLLIEPHTERAAIEYATLKGYIDHGVTKESPTSIQVTIPMGANDDFGAAEMMVSMLKASENLEENRGKTALERFADTNEKFFSILSELKKEQTGFWWDLYVSFFSELNKEDLVEPFSYYISLSQGDDAAEWLEANDDKFQALVNWLSPESPEDSSENDH